MNRHDYSQNTVSNISSTLLNCKSTVENTILSTESMSYSWDAGIIHNVVTWFEVLQINMAKSELEQLFQKADFKFDSVVQKVGEIDTASVSSLETGLTTLSAIKKKAELVWAFTKLYPTLSVVGCFDNLHTFTNQVDEEFNTVDFNNLTDKELEEYYQELFEKAKSGKLSEAEKDTIERLMEYLLGYTIKENITEADREKIAMFNELYEYFHPEIAERVENARKIHERQRGGSVALETKYQIYSEHMKEGEVSDTFIEHQINAASRYSSGFYRRLCEAQDRGEYMGVAESVYYLDKDEYYRHGSTSIYNFEYHKNDDGSVDVSFTASNQTKRITEITVYDGNGNVQERVYLNGQEDPSSIPGVFIECGKIGKDIVSGKAFTVDCESFNSKQDYNFTIPEGGYIQITDDPDEMNRYTYKEEVNSSKIAKTSGLLLDTVDIDTGNAVVDIGLEVAKSVAGKAEEGRIKGESVSIREYADEVGESMVGMAVDATCQGPAKIGLFGVDATLKVNSMAEGKIQEVQQEKSRGNKSLFICA